MATDNAVVSGFAEQSGGRGRATCDACPLRRVNCVNGKQAWCRGRDPWGYFVGREEYELEWRWPGIFLRPEWCPLPVTVTDCGKKGEG